MANRTPKSTSSRATKPAESDATTGLPGKEEPRSVTTEQLASGGMESGASSGKFSKKDILNSLGFNPFAKVQPSTYEVNYTSNLGSFANMTQGQNYVPGQEMPTVNSVNSNNPMPLVAQFNPSDRNSLAAREMANVAQYFMTPIKNNIDKELLRQIYTSDDAGDELEGEQLKEANDEFEAFAEIKLRDVEVFLTMIVNMKQVDTLLGSFAYAGFSADNVLTAFKNCALVAKITMDTMMGHIKKIIVYGIARGTSIVRRGVKNTEDDSAKKDIQELIRIYRIHDFIVGHNSPSVITVSRTMNAFPLIVASFMNVQTRNFVGDRNIIPKAYMTPSGAAMIPMGPEFDAFFELYVLWSASFTRVINRVKRQLTGKEYDHEKTISEQREWARLARESQTVDNNMRIYFLQNKVKDFEVRLTVVGGKVTRMDMDAFKPIQMVEADETMAEDNEDGAYINFADADRPPTVNAAARNNSTAS